MNYLKQLTRSEKLLRERVESKGGTLTRSIYDIDAEEGIERVQVIAI